ncbi:PAS domain S-box protein [Haladaptatus sp. NG-SE-30]
MTPFPKKQDSPDGGGFDAIASWLCEESQSLPLLFSALDDTIPAFAFERSEPLAWWTGRVAELTGFSDADLRSKRAVELVADTDRNRFDAEVQTALEDGETSISVTLSTGDEHRRTCDCRLIRISESNLLFAVITETNREPADSPKQTAREQELERYETIVQTVGDGIYTLDDQFRFVSVNEEMAELTGYSRDELVGAHGSLITDEETVNEALAQRERLIAGDIDVGEYDIIIERADGETVPIEVRFTALYDEVGTFYGTAGVMRDISERIDRDRKLQIERDRVAALFENSGDAIVYCESDGDVPIIEQVNPAFEDIFGFTADEVVGRPVDDVVVPSAFTDEAAEINRRARAGEYLEAEVKRNTAYGVRDFLLRPIPTRLGESSEEYYVVYTDITGRKEREQELERYETIVQTVGDGIYTTDDQFQFSTVNDAFVELTGYDRDELLGRTPALISDEVGLEESTTLRENVLAGDVEAETYTTSLYAADEDEIPVEIRFKSIPSDDSSHDQGTVGVVRDISERIERERELEETKTRLELALKGTETGVWEWNAKTSEVIWDQTVERIFGLEPGAFEGTYEAFLERVHPEDVSQIEQMNWGENIEYRIYRKDKAKRWVEAMGTEYNDVEGPERYIGIVRDITDRKERQRALRENEERLRTVVENVPVILFAIDDEGTFTLSEGRGLSTLDAEPGEAIGESIFDWLADYPDALSDVRRALAGETFRATHEIHDSFFETWYQPVRDTSDEVTGVIGVSMDVTERMRHEQALTALHTQTQEMLNAKSTDAVAQIAVDAGGSVLDLPGVVVYLYDEETNTLRPAAHSDEIPTLVGTPTPFAAGKSITWQVFATGETRVFDDVRESEHVYNPETDLRSGLYVPLGDHGVLIAVDDQPGVFEADAIELASIFAATTQAALDRVRRESALRERETELEQQKTRLERLHETTELLRDIEHLLVLADSRSEVVSTVCERLAATDRFAMAWIGTLDETASKIIPEAWAGSERGYLDSVSLRTNDDRATMEPAVKVALDRELTTIENISTGGHRESWRSEALRRGYQGIISLPLVYRDHSYGVLTVYATRPDAFSALSRSVFDELSETIAYAIDAIETKRGLLTDRISELVLCVRHSDDILQRIATTLECSLEYEGVVSDDEADHLFVTVRDADASDVEAYLDDVAGVVASRIVTERDETALFDISVTEPLFAVVLSERGAVPESITATEEEIRAVVNLPHSMDVREFVEALQTRYSGVKLAARRDHERPLQSVETCRAAFEERLTDRQQQVLETAYLSGFFESPRTTSGQEVAQALGIAQPTFMNHLRAAQRKLFELLLEPEPLDI